MLRYILAISMADKIARFMTFKGNSAEFFLRPELWEVVANVCLKSRLWMDGWIDGVVLGKSFRGLPDPINEVIMHFKCWEVCAEISLLKILHRTFPRFILKKN